jgi:hypothetical protein
MPRGQVERKIYENQPCDLPKFSHAIHDDQLSQQAQQGQGYDTLIHHRHLARYHSWQYSRRSTSIDDAIRTGYL